MIVLVSTINYLYMCQSYIYVHCFMEYSFFYFFGTHVSENVVFELPFKYLYTCIVFFIWNTLSFFYFFFCLLETIKGEDDQQGIFGSLRTVLNESNGNICSLYQGWHAYIVSWNKNDCF